MLYLVDSSIFIDAKDRYYQVDRVPEYWRWLEIQATEGRVKVPRRIFEEIAEKPDEDDPLVVWAKRNEGILLLREPLPDKEFDEVIDKGYAPDLRLQEYKKIGGDPFLIAHALVNKKDRTVVTSEASRSKTIRANRKIPDVCKTLGVQCCEQWDLIESLDFRTDFDKR
ncbi:DUF4411 family protein [Thioalkalivibrio sp. HK1]|uniref:DUF4411 family protein n=1 Tax=Thioalkalivibrio sp. HK1 TaxID=1469245 RepID=UPI0004717CA5|nr:DUF4411 family protein [Thioalkalivibrio sp. HK1]